MDGVSTTFCSKYITKLGHPSKPQAPTFEVCIQLNSSKFMAHPLHMSSWNGIASGAQGDVHSVAVHERAAFLDCYLERSKVIRLVANCEQTSTSPPHTGDLRTSVEEPGRKDGRMALTFDE